MKKLVQRIKSWFIRRRKQKPDVWLARWQDAFDNFWFRFKRMPENEKTLQWSERNHARIIKAKRPWDKK